METKVELAPLPKPTYKMWRVIDHDGRPNLKLKDWPVETAVTEDTYPVWDTGETDYNAAVRIAHAAGFRGAC